jgi:hypothetical protein
LKGEEPSDVQFTRFINKAGITLIGRRLEAQELEEMTNALQGFSSDKEKKAHVVHTLMALPEFYVNMEEQLREDLLEGISRADLRYTYLKDFYFLSETRGLSVMHPVFQKTFDQLSALAAIQDGKVDRHVDIKYLKQLLIDNYIYDQINMGIDNFVISTFQHFLQRKPTVSELQQAKWMVSGQSGVLLQMSGNSKEDYLDILLKSPSHWEAQIVYWYQKIYNQKPEDKIILHFMPLMLEDQSEEKLLASLLINL